MHISALKIRNFRNFPAAKFVFKKGVNTILGENGSGKTNALHALRLLLDDSLPRNATKLSESDFCRNLTNWQGHWIIISVDFKELKAHEGCQIMKHRAGHMNGDDTGTLTYFYRPKLHIRQKLFEATGESQLVQEIVDQLTADDYEVHLTGRATADFLDDKTYTALVGDFEWDYFPDPRDQQLDLYGVKIQPIHDEVSFTFIKALRDVVSDLKNYRNSPLLSLLKGIESEIDEGDADEITTLVSEINDAISGLDQIKDISTGIQDSLHKTVGYTFAPLIDIESSLPRELDKLMQRLTLTVGDNFVEGYRGDINELSLGGANLIYVALKLLEYERKQERDKAAQFLLIEEPEAHIHCHIQKTLFDSKSTLGAQVFLSTHSTHLSSASKISDMNILGLELNRAEVYYPANGLTPIECGRIERYLNATRSTLLFAKGVILVEGEAELILIPAMVKNSFGVSLDELGISLISMDCAFFEHLSKLFHPDRIRKNCAIVTDLDESIVPLPFDEDLDNAYQSSCRNSQKAGFQRKVALDLAIAQNPYVEAFYAEHTFEVDFVTADNSPEVIRTLESIYETRKPDRAKSSEKLCSSKLDVYGMEVLRLANKVGKGWFSLLLSEQVSSETYIPQYILKAVAFACGEQLSVHVLYKMCQYRLNNPLPVTDDEEKPIEFFEKNKNDKSLCIDKFVNTLRDDDLSYFINLLTRK